MILFPLPPPYHSMLTSWLVMHITDGTKTFPPCGGHKTWHMLPTLNSLGKRKVVVEFCQSIASSWSVTMATINKWGTYTEILRNFPLLQMKIAWRLSTPFPRTRLTHDVLHTSMLAWLGWEYNFHHTKNKTYKNKIQNLYHIKNRSTMFTFIRHIQLQKLDLSGFRVENMRWM